MVYRSVIYNVLTCQYDTFVSFKREPPDGWIVVQELPAYKIKAD